MSYSSVTPGIVAHQTPLSVGLSRKNTGIDCHFLLQGIFPTQGSNLHLLYWQVDSLPWSHQESSLLYLVHHKTVSRNACPEDNLGRPLCYHGKSSGSKDPTCRFRPGVNSCTDQGSAPHFSNTLFIWEKKKQHTHTHTHKTAQKYISQFLSVKWNKV